MTGPGTVRERETGWDPKAEAVRLWGADPCGGAVGSLPEGTPDFFAAVDEERYGRYAPWMRASMGFDLARGKRLLEVGCGMGTDLAQFGRGGASVVGIDLVPRHLTIARRRLVHEGCAPRLLCSDAEALPFKDASVDVVYSFGVLHHTPGIEAALAEIRRVLRPGGEAVIGLYHRDSLFYWGSTILRRGIVQGGLFRHGYRRLMADIERHDHSDALPLVRVYSRRKVRRLLRSFTSVSLATYHPPAAHVHFLSRRLPAVIRPFVERCSQRWGWYVVARARK